MHEVIAIDRAAPARGPKAEPVIHVAGVRKRYGEGATAVDALLGVDLEIERGCIVGILGPNGAGKTTLIEILEGIRQPDVGTVRILGEPIHDPVRSKLVRHRMGIALQHSVLPPLLTVEELLSLQRSLYSSRVDVGELIGTIGLTEKRYSKIQVLSGGQQQRVAVAMALVADPELMFLDEPTSQLDPQARRLIWDTLHAQRRRNDATILLTTHQMEEAHRICDRVVIIDAGQVVAEGAPDDLIAAHCRERHIHVALPAHTDLSFLPGTVTVTPTPTGLSRVRITTQNVGMVLSDLGNLQARTGTELRDLRIEQPSLEDVFIALTGHGVS